MHVLRLILNNVLMQFFQFLQFSLQYKYKGNVSTHSQSDEQCSYLIFLTITSNAASYALLVVPMQEFL